MLQNYILPANRMQLFRTYTMPYIVLHPRSDYTHGIYAEGYIVFVFLLVRSYVRSFVRLYFRPVRGITSKFYVQAT